MQVTAKNKTKPNQTPSRVVKADLWKAANRRENMASALCYWPPSPAQPQAVNILTALNHSSFLQVTGGFYLQPISSARNKERVERAFRQLQGPGKVDCTSLLSLGYSTKRNIEGILAPSPIFYRGEAMVIKGMNFRIHQTQVQISAIAFTSYMVFVSELLHKTRMKEGCLSQLLWSLCDYLCDESGIQKIATRSISASTGEKSTMPEEQPAP